MKRSEYEIEAVLSVGTWSTEVELYADTGFEGGVVIPHGVAREILADPSDDLMQVADGRVVPVLCWYGTVELESRMFRCSVASLGDRFLLGREVLDKLGDLLHLRQGSAAAV